MNILNSLGPQHKVTFLLNNQAYVLDAHIDYEINSQTPDLQGTIDVDGNYIGSIAQTAHGAYQIVQGVDSPGIYIKSLN